MTDGPGKLVGLRRLLKPLGKVAVAYSGGADSTLLLKVARDELGDGALAIVIAGDIMPETELRDAVSVARGLGVEPMIVRADLLSSPGFRDNPVDRCYLCKKAIFTGIVKAAHDRGFDIIADGSHTGDLEEDRPGRRALRELGVRSPLTEAGFDKEDVRSCSALLGLPTALKPASPCLATRIPFGQEITAEKLHQVDMAERTVRALGIEVVRVRHHGAIARIEVLPRDIPAVVSHRDRLVPALRELGFAYIDVDLRGYRPGSMSEAVERDRSGPPLS